MDLRLNCLLILKFGLVYKLFKDSPILTTIWVCKTDQLTDPKIKKQDWDEPPRIWEQSPKV